MLSPFRNEVFLWISGRTHLRQERTLPDPDGATACQGGRLCAAQVLHDRVRRLVSGSVRVPQLLQVVAHLQGGLLLRLLPVSARKCAA